MNTPLQTIKQSWKDFLSWKMLALNLGPVVLGLLFWGILLFYFGGNLVRILEGFLPTSWYQYAHTSGLLPALFLLAFKLFAYVLLVLLVLVLSLVGNLFISLFYTPLVITSLHKRYYSDLALENFGDLSRNIQHFLKQLAYLCLFLVVCIPLYFIPFIGVFISLIPHYFFFKNTLLFDVGSSIYNEQTYQKILIDYKVINHKIAIAAYLFSLIPVFNFFATLLQTIILARHFLEIKAHKA
ncbi:EI24 domain-containing protein [Helicobacter suis]|uniref:EI24 domain-containing protein n=1 Tax=Helicobacter suis TaxID=104628 RepID=UPI000CF177F7|nr:EI24 domain-containing protein [Helicobacter suis]BCD49478.1 Putative Sulfate Transporter CysZ [Helicobacter suis]